MYTLKVVRQSNGFWSKLITLDPETNKTDKLIVRASDTNVLIILLGMIAKHGEYEVQVQYEDILMDVGHGNNQRYVSVTNIYNEMENNCPGVSAAIVGLHTLTGTDYISAF